MTHAIARLAIAAALLSSPVSASAQAAAGGVVAIMPLAEVVSGMRGTGMTVVQGWEPQPFGVEVLGVLPDVFPKQSLIVARLTGLGLERSGVVAGMSGSPVYIDDRLVGAVAYRLVSFGHEAIAGLIPIESMLAMPEARGAGEMTAAVPVREWLTAVAAVATGQDPGDTVPVGVAGVAGVEPIGTPLAMSGFHPEVVRAVSPLFAAHGWMVAPGAGTAAVRPYLEPGGAVAVQLVRGDVAVTAAGTVTHRDGPRLLAFGHPFVQAGEVDFPMVAAEVLTVLSASQASSKLTVAGREVLGAIRQDRLPAILGLVGESPRLLPVTARLRAPGLVDTLDFEVVVDPMLTPLYVFLGLVSGVQSIDDIGAGGALEVAATLRLAGGVEVRFDDLYSSSSQAIVGAAADLAGVFSALYDNRVVLAELERVEIDLHLHPERRVGTVVRAWHDGAAVKPGQLLRVWVVVAPYRQEEKVVPVTIRVPEDVVPGPLRVLVGDATAATAAREEALGGVPEPRGLDELAALYNQRRRHDRLYVQLFRQAPGLRLGDEVMPGLPGSRLRLQSGPDAVALAERVVADEAIALDMVVSGSLTLTVNVRPR